MHKQWEYSGYLSRAADGFTLVHVHVPCCSMMYRWCTGHDITWMSLLCVLCDNVPPQLLVLLGVWLVHSPLPVCCFTVFQTVELIHKLRSRCRLSYSYSLDFHFHRVDSTLCMTFSTVCWLDRLVYETHLFLFFYSCIVPLGFSTLEIRVAFPGESQLQQGHTTQSTVHAGCFSVSIKHWTLTWTTRSLN